MRKIVCIGQKGLMVNGLSIVLLKLVHPGGYLAIISALRS